MGISFLFFFFPFAGEWRGDCGGGIATTMVTSAGRALSSSAESISCNVVAGGNGVTRLTKKCRGVEGLSALFLAPSGRERAGRHKVRTGRSRQA